MNAHLNAHPSMSRPTLRRRLAMSGAAIVLAAAGASSLNSASGATLFESVSPSLLVPDGNDSGIVSTIQIPNPGRTILDVNVTLTLAGEPGGGWNGDLYVYLAHSGALSVLANRPGVTGANPFGYGDNGLAQVTFDDDGAQGDFHEYQIALNAGDSDFPISGTFEPDARLTDPAQVLPGDPRSAFLSGFNGLDPAGEWRLFVADLSPGGELRLASWAIEIVTGDVVPIPETGTGLAMAGCVTLLLGLGPWLARRRAARSKTG
ncbi:MAG: hypothetical protein AB7O66_06350 [Limisphaerales bacterium]